jgi:hypothetical protein
LECSEAAVGDLTLPANCSRSDFFSKPAAQRAVVLHYGRSIGVSNIFRLSFGYESVAIPG